MIKKHLIFLTIIFLSTNALGETLTIDDAVTKAVESNFDIQTAKKELDKQEGQLTTSIGGLLPDLVATGNYRKIDDQSIQTFNEERFGVDRTWDVGIEVQQPIFRGGKGSASYSRESLLRDAAKLNLEEITNQVISQTKISYFNTQLAKAQILVAEKLVGLREELLRREKARLEVGKIPPFDVLRAEVSLANSRTPFIKAKNDFRIAQEELRKILGETAGVNSGEIEVSGELSFVPEIVVLEDALSRAEANRPELKRLALIEEAAAKNINIERAEFFPSVSAYAGYGWQQSQFNKNDEFHGWQAGLRAQWKIFDSFKTIGKVTTAEALKEQARIAREKLIEGVRVETRQVISTLQEATELVAASKKVAQQGEESLRQADERLNAGAGTQLDVLESQLALTEARTNEISALHAYNVSLAKFRAVIGER